jgi:hypothetical protein
MNNKRLIPLAVLALAVACTESASNPQESSVTDGLKPQFLATVNLENAPEGAHFRQGFSAPECIISGLTVSCSGTQIAGVGNTDADVSLAVTYAATVQCRNHGGQIVEVKTQSTTVAPAPDELTELRNGTLIVGAFSASSVPTDETFEALATCPNGNWTKEVLGDPSVSSFIYTLTFEGFSEPAISVSGPDL